MSARSMTGFGRARIKAGTFAAIVEVSSVNRRQLDIRLDLPRSLAVMESDLLRRIRSAISRGSVLCTVRLEGASKNKGGGWIDMAAAAGCLNALRKAAHELSLKDDFGASVLLSMPGVMRGAPDWQPEVVRPQVEQALAQAMAAHSAMRLREGRAMAADINKRLLAVGRRLLRIERRAPAAALRHRKNLLRRIREAGIACPEDKLLREAVVYAERCDITEEIVRLRSHLAQAGSALKAKEPMGRSMDFLLQEMLREINTIGSKGNDALIAREVVAVKSELERVREQVQNIE